MKIKNIKIVLRWAEAGHLRLFRIIRPKLPSYVLSVGLGKCWFGRDKKNCILWICGIRFHWQVSHGGIFV